MKRVSRRWAHVLRALTLVGFVLAGFLLWRIVERDPAFEAVESEDGQVSVQDAIAIARGEPLTVTGYVFLGAGWTDLRLCNGKERGDPPRCLGPFLYLEGVDAGSFHLEEGEGDEGPVQWSPEAVTVVGPVIGTTITVQYVL